MATKKQKAKVDEPSSKDSQEDEEFKKLSKNKLITLILIFIFLIVIVYVAFLGMGRRPVSQLTKEEALETLTTIYGTSWLLDDNGISYPLAERRECYQRIFLTADLDREKLMLPIYLFLDKNENVIGREIAILYFDEDKSLLRSQMPDGNVYDFVYSQAKDGQMENLAFIGSDNKRTFYIKEEIASKLN